MYLRDFDLCWLFVCWCLILFVVMGVVLFMFCLILFVYVFLLLCLIGDWCWIALGYTYCVLDLLLVVDICLFNLVVCLYWLLLCWSGELLISTCFRVCYCRFVVCCLLIIYCCWWMVTFYWLFFVSVLQLFLLCSVVEDNCVRLLSAISFVLELIILVIWV